MLVANRLVRSETHIGLPQGELWLDVLSYCGRDWFAPVGGEIRAPGDGQNLARISCEWCGRAPSKKSTLLQCSGCKQARYCCKACQTSAWKAHKAWCKANR